MARQQVGKVDRREVLQGAAAVGVGAMLPNGVWSQETKGGDAWKRAIVKYLDGLAKEDGGYGFEGQERGHLTPTWAVIGCYRLLEEPVPRAKEVAQFVRTHHPRELKGQLGQEMRQFEWQQIQSLVWLGEDVSSFREIVLSWKAPFAYPKQYERHGYPVFQQEVSAILSWKLVGLPREDLPVEFIEYLNSRRRQNGSFNNTPLGDGSDGHVLNTWWGLQALAALETERYPVDWNKAATAEWLRGCQFETGGFGYQPSSSPGKFGRPSRATADTMADWEDVAYTSAAVRSLSFLGAQPIDRDGCKRNIQQLRNADGGYADRKGWLSNPLATFYALDALSALEALQESPLTVPAATRPRLPITEDLKVYSIQIEAHGQGSPADAVELADQLRIHLWGAKNAKPGWISQAQLFANEQGVDVKFFVADEEYGTWIDVPGMGTYSHMSDVVAPRGVDMGKSLAGDDPVTWPEFRRRRLSSVPRTLSGAGPFRLPIDQGVRAKVIAELHKARQEEIRKARAGEGRLISAGGGLIWQFGENEPLVRMLLDDSLQVPPFWPYDGGYSAISTYHFGNPDFTNTSPFLMRYRGQIPFVALQDAHGEEPWWFADMTAGFRTLFLARQPTWEGWLEALKNNWVVAVRHDAVSGGKTWMHGLLEVIDVVKEQWQEWQWWDNPSVERPLVSVVALTPTDAFEVGRPEKGVAVRVRCAMTNTTHGLPKTPIAEFVKLMVAGKRVEPEHVVKRRPNGALEDEYYLYAWSEVGPGRYTATATVRRVGTGREIARSIAFGA